MSQDHPSSNHSVCDIKDDIFEAGAPAFPGLPKSKENSSPKPVRQVSFDDMEIQKSSSEQTTDAASKPKEGGREAGPTNELVSVEIGSFWFSYNATKLFSPKDGEAPEEAVNNMIDLLDTALKDRKYFGCILNGGNDALLFLAEMDLDKISVKVCHVLAALKIAKETIDSCQRFSFRECCNKAVAELSSVVPRDERAKGITVSRWFRLFRRTRTFELPAAKKELVMTRRAISAYFGANPEMHNVFLHHMTRYLRTGIHDNLACATAYKYFKETLLPIGAHESGYGLDCFPLYLRLHNLTHLNQRTFEAWFRDILAYHRPAASLQC